MERKYIELSICDKGNGNTEVKLNDQNITNGLLNYSIYRSAEENETIYFKCELVVVPKKIDIELKKRTQ